MCAETPSPSPWFADDPGTQAQARAVCVQACPARAECLAAGRHEPAGIWGGLTFEQRAAAGWYREPPAVCPACTLPLDPGHAGPFHPACDRARQADARKAARAQASAGRACARCGVAMWAQARSCIICHHQVGDPLPNRPWPGGPRYADHPV